MFYYYLVVMVVRIILISSAVLVEQVDQLKRKIEKTKRQFKEFNKQQGE